MDDFEQQPTQTMDLAEQRKRMSSLLCGLQYKKLINGCISILAGAMFLFLPLVSFLGLADISLWDLGKDYLENRSGESQTLLETLLSWNGKDAVLGSVGIIGSLLFAFVVTVLGVMDVLRGLISILTNEKAKIDQYQGMGLPYANDPTVVRYLNGIQSDKYKNPVSILIGAAILLAFFYVPPILYLRYMKQNLFAIQEAQVVLWAVVWLVYIIKIYASSWYVVNRREDMKLLLGVFGKDGLKLV